MTSILVMVNWSKTGLTCHYENSGNYYGKLLMTNFRYSSFLGICVNYGSNSKRPKYYRVGQGVFCKSNLILVQSNCLRYEDSEGTKEK